MLATVPKENADACIEALRQAGYPSTCRIGEIFENLPAVATAPEQVVFVQDAKNQFSATGESKERVRPIDLNNCDTGACEIPISKRQKSK